MNANEILLYLAIKNDGNWDKIYHDILLKANINEEEYEPLKASIKSKYVTLLDDDYPTVLKSMVKPPFVLFYYGDLSILTNYNKFLAIIGSRNYSKYGRMMTFSIIEELDEDIVIISGLARGIDSFAHESAISNNHKTIAVLGSGIDVCYPAQSQELYDVIKKDHLLISEYPNNVEPVPDNFPIRNRIIAGLSQAVLVTEADKRSGTSITVNYALASGRDVFAVPHLAHKCSLCNLLIKDGAKLVEHGEDINDEFNKYQFDGEKNLKDNL